MTLKQIEARLARLEADPRHGRFARLSEAELESEIFQRLDILAADHPTYAALLADMAISRDPAEQECAYHLRAFLRDHAANQLRGTTQ